MTTQSYPPPVDQLLIYGVCDPRDDFKYVEKLELTADHIPDLICMAIDPDLNQANSDSLAIWAPVHAWRSLGQLRAEAAIEPARVSERSDRKSRKITSRNAIDLRCNPHQRTGSI